MIVSLWESHAMLHKGTIHRRALVFIVWEPLHFLGFFIGHPFTLSLICIIMPLISLKFSAGVSAPGE